MSAGEQRGRKPPQGGGGVTAPPAGSVEEALKRLEAIVQRLEGGKVELAEALTLCREGRSLHDLCMRELGRFEAQLEILTSDGRLVPEEPFPAGGGEAQGAEE